MGHLLKDALTTEEVMGTEVPHDLALDEPSNRELLEYLGLDDEEIEVAMSGIEDDMKTGIQRFESKYQKEPGIAEVNKYLGTSMGGAGFKPASQGTLYAPRCNARHDGGEYIFKLGEKTIGGAKGSDLQGKYANLVVDLAGVFSDRVDRWKRDAMSAKKFIKSGPDKFNVLSDFIEDTALDCDIPEVLRLDWIDMKAPPVSLRFWQEMWNLLPDGHTVFCCVGGHGRTGTALAAMIIAADKKITPKNAIALVRKLHCKDAIETISQEDYLEKIASDRSVQIRNKRSK